MNRYNYVSDNDAKVSLRKWLKICRDTGSADSDKAERRYRWWARIWLVKCSVANGGAFESLRDKVEINI